MLRLYACTYREKPEHKKLKPRLACNGHRSAPGDASPPGQQNREGDASGRVLQSTYCACTAWKGYLQADGPGWVPRS